MPQFCSLYYAILLYLLLGLSQGRIWGGPWPPPKYAPGSNRVVDKVNRDSAPALLYNNCCRYKIFTQSGK